MARQKGIKMNKPTKKELYAEIEGLHEQLKMAQETITLLSNGKVVPFNETGDSIPVDMEETK